MTILTTTPTASPLFRDPAGCAAPVPHDFPFLTCTGCGFPIPPWDLVGDEYQHWHASTCAEHTSEAARPVPRVSPVLVGSGGSAARGAAVQSTERRAVAGAGGLPTVPPLGVKGAPQVPHPLRGRPQAAALDPEPLAARRVAVGAGTACPGKRPPAIERNPR